MPILQICLINIGTMKTAIAFVIEIIIKCTYPSIQINCYQIFSRSFI